MAEEAKLYVGSRANKQFCGKCGRKLVQNKKIIGYDEYDGSPIQPYLDQQVCPNQDDHDEAEAHRDFWGSI